MATRIIRSHTVRMFLEPRSKIPRNSPSIKKTFESCSDKDSSEPSAKATETTDR